MNSLKVLCYEDDEGKKLVETKDFPTSRKKGRSLKPAPSSLDRASAELSMAGVTGAEGQAASRGQKTYQW